ncbi:MAG: TatD family hydrolase [Terriglobales bacterium]
MLDSHCHPDDAAFAGAGADLLTAAAAAGVRGLVAIAGLDFARQHQQGPLRVWATVGVHPHEAAAATLPTAAELDDPLVIAIGEIGLDYHYPEPARELQMQVFEQQLQLAAAHDLPVSIHCRDAFPDCLAAIARQTPPRRGVFHCFSGSREEAEQVLALGWCLSFSGLLTFPKLQPLRDIATWVPPDRILIETDAPYLAPVPHRGKINQPAWVRDTAQTLAHLRGLTLEETAAVTTANFHRLFPRA